MEELLEKITSSPTHLQQILWISGPPGSGKTTTLFWLYQQCKMLSSFCSVVIPMHRMSVMNESILTKLRTAQGSLLVFVDFSKPLNITLNCFENIQTLLLGIWNNVAIPRAHTIVIATSSNFLVYLKTSTAASGIRTLYQRSAVYETKKFSAEQANEYVSSVANSEVILELSKIYQNC